MIQDIEKLEDEIVERLKVVDPDKIILFGSYARGTQTEDSDIDLYLFKNVTREEVRDIKFRARKSLPDLTFKYHLGFDILVAPEKYVREREDYFCRVDILQDGRILYAK